ncbi:MAG TPA: 1-acyl-sn-glycerol-3-phosphate acyltransferase, partial [Spirochaetota bacterium]|nr:1-acyl-sn-glycerol-3-phosphate acyltransferase [Spirochaetota bacterium]
MANHQSIIDIPVLLKLEDCRLIAKHSILWWPFIGPMAFILGIIFIKREAIKTLKPAIARAGMTLVQGISLAVFPEGTTNNGRFILPVKSSFLTLYQKGFKTVPVYIHYARYNDKQVIPEAFPSLFFHGSTGIIKHLFFLMQARRIEV